MNEYLEKYRAIKDDGKAIAAILFTVKKDDDGNLYADTNIGWYIDLMNCQDELVEAFLEDEYELINQFEIEEEGMYEFEVVFNLIANIHPGSKAYYELDYFENTYHCLNPDDCEEYS